jgi:hypothetical protein
MPRGSTRQKEDKQKTTASSSAAKSQAKSNASKGNYGKMSDKAQNKLLAPLIVRPIYREATPL